VSYQCGYFQLVSALRTSVTVFHIEIQPEILQGHLTTYKLHCSVEDNKRVSFRLDSRIVLCTLIFIPFEPRYRGLCHIAIKNGNNFWMRLFVYTWRQPSHSYTGSFLWPNLCGFFIAHTVLAQWHLVTDRRVMLTLILLTWRIWWAPNNASKWQMEFNSEFKGLK